MSFDLWLFGRRPFDTSEWETILHETVAHRAALKDTEVVRDDEHCWRIYGESSVWIDVHSPPKPTDRRIESCGPPGAKWYAMLSANTGCAPGARWVQVAVPYVALMLGDGFAAHDCTTGVHELGCFETAAAYGAFMAKRMEQLCRLRALRRMGLVGAAGDNPFE